MSMNELYSIYLQHLSVQTDTRKLKPGDIFFALKGPNFNGNLYAKQALESGASLCVVDEEVGFADERLFYVADVLEALQQLAKHHREQFDIPFIAITGSNGKTTTKELIHAVLSEKYTVYTTEGNLNNHIGVPLTILKIRSDAQIAVIEMGANHQQEIAAYCKYAQPTHGLITNCGKAHLEGFGGEEGVRKGKGELFDYLREHNGTAFVFADHHYFEEMSKGISNIILYGTTANVSTCGVVSDDKRLLEVRMNDDGGADKLQTQLVGGYNLPNVLAAVCVGRYFDVRDVDIKKAIEGYHPSNSRSQLVEKNGNTVILDAYNANPSSMKLAIENFAAMLGGNKVLMLGAMMELGEASATEHSGMVSLIDQFSWKAVVLVGAPYASCYGKYLFFPNAIEAGEWFKQQHFHGMQILIKGSRSMQMEKVIE